MDFVADQAKRKPFWDADPKYFQEETQSIKLHKISIFQTSRNVTLKVSVVMELNALKKTNHTVVSVQKDTITMPKQNSALVSYYFCFHIHS